MGRSPADPAKPPRPDHHRSPRPRGGFPIPANPAKQRQTLSSRAPRPPEAGPLRNDDRIRGRAMAYALAGPRQTDPRPPEIAPTAGRSSPTTHSDAPLSYTAREGSLTSSRTVPPPRIGCPNVSG